MRLLVRRSSGIAKRFEETGEPVPLSAAKDEHWIAGCHLPRKFGETGHPCRIQAGYPPLHG